MKHGYFYTGNPNEQESKDVDFKLPVDTLVEVDEERYRHYRNFSDGLFSCFVNGCDSRTTDYVTEWCDLKILENEPRPWFGGECPVSGWVEIKIYTREGSVFTCFARAITPEHWMDGIAASESAYNDIIAYQILEQDIPEGVL